jgi:hypothetical protein
LRLTLSASHSQSDIEKAVVALKRLNVSTQEPVGRVP